MTVCYTTLCWVPSSAHPRKCLLPVSQRGPRRSADPWAGKPCQGAQQPGLQSCCLTWDRHLHPPNARQTQGPSSGPGRGSASREASLPAGTGQHGPVGRAVQSCVCSRQAPKCRHRGGRVPPPRRPGCRGHLWLLRSFLNAIASLREKAPGEARRLSDSSLPRARLRRLLSPACFPGQWPPGRQSQTVVPDPVEEGRGHSISRPLTVKTGSPPTLGRTCTGQ